MHDTAFEIGKRFFDTYWQNGFNKILDVGSRNVNGTLRNVRPPSSEYVGVDLSAGPGVDVILDDPNIFPFQDAFFDVVVSTSCFEHDQFFWLTFGEMLRVVRPSGYIYINAPSNGSYHGYPYDNWRFYPDCGRALEAWSARGGHPAHLVESFVAKRDKDIWCDMVMVFCRGEIAPKVPSSFLYDRIPGVRNIRFLGNDNLESFQERPQDLLELEDARGGVRELESMIAQREARIDELMKKLLHYEERDRRHLEKHALLRDELAKVSKLFGARMEDWEQGRKKMTEQAGEIDALMKDRKTIYDRLIRSEAQLDLLKSCVSSIYLDTRVTSVEYCPNSGFPPLWE